MKIFFQNMSILLNTVYDRFFLHDYNHVIIGVHLTAPNEANFVVFDGTLMKGMVSILLAVNNLWNSFAFFHIEYYGNCPFLKVTRSG